MHTSCSTNLPKWFNDTLRSIGIHFKVMKSSSAVRLSLQKISADERQDSGWVVVFQILTWPDFCVSFVLIMFWWRIRKTRHNQPLLAYQKHLQPNVGDASPWGKFECTRTDEIFQTAYSDSHWFLQIFTSVKAHLCLGGQFNLGTPERKGLKEKGAYWRGVLIHKIEWRGYKRYPLVLLPHILRNRQKILQVKLNTNPTHFFPKPCKNYMENLWWPLRYLLYVRYLI